MPSFHRRRFLGASALTVAAFSTKGVFAELLQETPTVGEGPFYPNKLPLDTDNDLLRINDAITPAVGEVTHLTGKLQDINGSPIRNAVVEIWQVDNHGVYIHTQGGDRNKLDGNFQGFGRFLTGMNGEYYFRTLKPVAYPGRPPHIHFKVKLKGGQKYKDGRDFTTQLFVKGDKRIEQDGLFRNTNAEGRKSLLVDFKPLEGSKAGELRAKFDITLGVTPQDDHG